MNGVGFDFPTTPPANTDSNWWTGLTNLFGAISQDVSGVWHTVEGTSSPLQPVFSQPSSTVRQQPFQQPSSGTGTSLIMLLLLGAVIYFGLRRK